jgi:hypothetical protein
VASILASGLGQAATTGDGQPDPTALPALVRRLRGQPPRPAAAANGSASPAAGPRHRGTFPQLQLLEPPTIRPSRIAKKSPDIEELLGSAVDEEWLVRISYVNSKGDDTEFYAEVLDVNRRAVTVRRLPRGTIQQLTPARIQWARIATEAEEEAQLP